MGQIVDKQSIASQPGTYEYEWDGTAYPSGVYFYKLTVGDASAPLSTSYTDSKKMILIK